MKIHVSTLGPQGLGALGRAAAVDQTIDVLIDDWPRVEITLDNGATLLLRPQGQDTIEILNNTGGAIYIWPRASNMCAILVPGAVQYVAPKE
jgi:hypothetical protein